MGTDKQKDTVNIYVAYVIVVNYFILCHVLNSSDSNTDFLGTNQAFVMEQKWYF